MDHKKTMWNETIDEILKGYKENEDSYICAFCGCEYIKGNIYKIGERLYDAYGAIKKHTSEKHGYAVDYLLNKEPSLVGISEIQQKILKLMAESKDDKTIAHEVGIAYSTVRSHRYKLREKQKQAKLFLALMQSLEEKTSKSISQSDSGNIEEIHQTATMVDERYNITDKERQKTINTYMDENGAVKQFPAKEKKKIILLREIMKNFVRDREYPEKEVNRILKRIYEDFATIRRALIEYGFLDRSEDCKVYRVKE